MPGGRGNFSPVQTMDFGPVGSPLTFDEADRPKAGQLGMLVAFNNQAFRLVQVDVTPADDIDLIDGGVMYWSNKLLWVVTANASESEADENGVAGGCHVAMNVSAFTVDRYIFVQVGGEQAAVRVAASVVQGDHLSGQAGANDNELLRTDGALAPVGIPFGTALTSRASTTTDNGATLTNSARVKWNYGMFL